MIEEKKTGKERTQPATRNEEWSDERIKAFLSLEPPEGVPADYHILLKAYRGMLPEQFTRFVPFFVEAGHDINVTLESGATFLDHLAQHRRAAPYMEILESHGARRGA
ncbi:PA4642 family protein [Pseudohongiella sp. SYSU M77423]|nr:PA4642 family protein [Pseudohongiella sp. SYSU M77423]MAO39907.1 hypothetical protein [Pseudohongiella sp.]MAY57196.1 hypothetical protein [Gammaproteobacteria bacterium]MDH7942417.1 PA4642 family protein [Pseudohongiella sp. SYSU M77423]HBX38566.1 hypothetical protein [Pseudohongiella sp.]|tara:strand:+ start:999 stop:1322 length:324 start_codon:yes stop_codon:yes gene_type:complete